MQTEFMPQDHTGDNIVEALKGVYKSWNLCPARQVCLTTDNGSNIVCAARTLEWKSLSCFGHNLHLAIGKAMDDGWCSRAGSSKYTFSMS